MPNDPSKRVARINKQELTDMPAAWTDQERGQFLRLLLQFKGIDPHRFYTVVYYPERSCWLVSQEPAGGRHTTVGANLPGDKADEALYRRLRDEFRRTAVAAVAALAAHSPHLARHGGKYQLPPKLQEITPTDLLGMIGGPGAGGPPVRFDTEGGWHSEPSDN